MPVVERAAAKLTPGFSCVTRIIDTRQVNTADMAEIKNIHQCLIACGMRRVVRVGAAPGKHRFHLVGKEWRFLSQNADSLEDAERLLDEPTAQRLPAHQQAAN